MDFKQKVLHAMNRLGDTATTAVASKELLQTVQTLNEHNLPIFMSCLLDIGDHDKPLAKREYVKLLGIVAAHHGARMTSFVQRIVMLFYKLLKDADTNLREACGEALGRIVRHVPVTPEKEGSSPLAVYLRPLFRLLADQKKSAQLSGAHCLMKVIENGGKHTITAREPILSGIIKHINQKQFSARPALFGCIISLIENASEAIIPQVGDILNAAVDGLASDDWATRKSAAECLTTLAAVLGPAISTFREEILEILQQCRHDKIKPVRDAVQEALRYYVVQGTAIDESQLTAESVEANRSHSPPKSTTTRLPTVAGRTAPAAAAASVKKRVATGAVRTAKSGTALKGDDIPHSIYVPVAKTPSKATGAATPAADSPARGGLGGTGHADSVQHDDEVFEVMTSSAIAPVGEEPPTPGGFMSYSPGVAERGARFHPVPIPVVGDEADTVNVGSDPSADQSVAVDDFESEKENFDETSVVGKPKRSTPANGRSPSFLSRPKTATSLSTSRSAWAATNDVAEQPAISRNRQATQPQSETSPIRTSTAVSQSATQTTEPQRANVATSTNHELESIEAAATATAIAVNTEQTRILASQVVEINAQLKQLAQRQAEMMAMFEEFTGGVKRAMGSIDTKIKALEEVVAELHKDYTVRERRFDTSSSFAPASLNDPSDVARQSTTSVWNSVNSYLTLGNIAAAYNKVLADGDALLLLRLMQQTGPVLHQLDPPLIAELTKRQTQLLRSNTFVEGIFKWLEELVDSYVTLPAAVVQDLLAALGELAAEATPLSFTAEHLATLIKKRITNV